MAVSGEAGGRDEPPEVGLKQQRSREGEPADASLEVPSREVAPERQQRPHQRHRPRDGDAVRPDGLHRHAEEVIAVQELFEEVVGELG